jgi:hypothetical protein
MISSFQIQSNFPFPPQILSRQLLGLFLLVRPHVHKHRLRSDPFVCGIFYNDCLYLAFHLILIPFYGKTTQKKSTGTNGNGTNHNGNKGSRKSYENFHSSSLNSTTLNLPIQKPICWLIDQVPQLRKLGETHFCSMLNYVKGEISGNFETGQNDAEDAYGRVLESLCEEQGGDGANGGNNNGIGMHSDDNSANMNVYPPPPPGVNQNNPMNQMNDATNGNIDETCTSSSYLFLRVSLDERYAAAENILNKVLVYLKKIISSLGWVLPRKILTKTTKILLDHLLKEVLEHVVSCPDISDVARINLMGMGAAGGMGLFDMSGMGNQNMGNNNIGNTMNGFVGNSSMGNHMGNNDNNMGISNNLGITNANTNALTANNSQFGRFPPFSRSDRNCLSYLLSSVKTKVLDISTRMRLGNTNQNCSFSNNSSSAMNNDSSSNTSVNGMSSASSGTVTSDGDFGLHGLTTLTRTHSDGSNFGSTSCKSGSSDGGNSSGTDNGGGNSAGNGPNSNAQEEDEYFTGQEEIEEEGRQRNDPLVQSKYFGGVRNY